MADTQTSWYVEALGTVQARRGPWPVDLGHNKQRAVFAFLAMRAGQAVTMEEMKEAVWGPRPPASARHLVHTYVARLRQALEPEVARRQRVHVIGSAGSGYRLQVDSGHVDVSRFRHLVADARLQLRAGSRRRAFELLGEAVRLWRDPSLADLCFLLHNSDEIEALRRDWVSTALDYVTIGLESGVAPMVLPAAAQLAAAEPLHEEIQARYLSALDHCGQRTVALEHFGVIRARLRDQLGVHPGPALAAAHRSLLHGARQGPTRAVGPVLDAGTARPPWRGPGPAVGDLVQRDGDIEALAQLLAGHRLVTVTGPPGCGKSAVALHTAARLRDSLTGGVVVVDAADISDADRLAAHVLDQLEVTGDADDLGGVLGEQQLLLVLDNVEHVVDACAQVVDHVVRACPHASVLVTSRERLGLPAESVWPVHPLPLPDPEDAHDLGDNPAVGLFARRAAQVRPGFRVQHDNAAAVATICRGLDGLPLALELAAACLATDTLEGVLRRLDNPLGEIRPARRGVPAHHRSLHSALKRSGDSLSAMERWLFHRLANLPQQFDLDAVRRECEPNPWNVDVRTVLDKLVDKSLLSLVQRTGGPSYQMLRVVRRLAAETSAVAPTPVAGG